MRKQPWVRALIIIVCLYLIVTTVQAMADLWKAGDKELERQRNLVALEQEQKRLLAEKNEASKPEYWEKIARDKLGMSKPGEETLVIPQELLQDQTVPIIPDTRPNWRKWLNLVL